MPQSQSNPSKSSDQLLSILLHVGEVERSDNLPTLQITTPAVPAKPSFNDVFAAAENYNRNISEESLNLHAIEYDLFGKTFAQDPHQVKLTDIAERAIDHLFKRAERVFAPVNGTLAISQTVEMDVLGYKNYFLNYHEIRATGRLKPGQYPVDLDRIWKHLESKFGGVKGETLGFQQVAKILISKFHLDDDDCIKRTSTGVTITLPLRSEKKAFGLDCGKMAVVDWAKNEVGSIFSHLASFAQWAGMPELSSNLKPDNHLLGNSDFVFSPRDTFKFEGINVTLLIKKWEFKLSVAVAQKLMLFLGEFGT